MIFHKILKKQKNVGNENGTKYKQDKLGCIGIHLIFRRKKKHKTFFYI